MPIFDKNAQVNDYKIKQNRLCVPFAIVHNATPASKTSSNDLPGAMVLAMEGLTAAAAAIDSGTGFTTPVDSTGIFGVLLYNLGTVAKVVNCDTRMLSSGTATVALKGASSSGVTASGNIAVSVDWSGDLSATDLNASFIVEYNVSKA